MTEESMAADDQPDASGSRRRRPRAWWQWVLGTVLLAGAVLSLIVRYAPQLWPPGPMVAIAPRRIRVPRELTAMRSVPAAPAELAGSNLLLVTLDTTRADRIGCYGNRDIETPNIDRLAREGVLFSDAIAPAPATLPSHASMLTGLYPYHHGARANAVFRLGNANETLAEVLSAHGYATGAFVSAYVLDPQFGIAQGFEHYDCQVRSSSGFWNEVAERPANETCDLAMSWLREHDAAPFFLWVHLFDPHWAYQPPAPFDERYKRRPYDGEIAFADAQLGRLLDLLDELGMTEKTLVVVAGDHGEGLFQHDEATHGCLVYGSTLHVPLIMRWGRRLGGGAHIERPVSLVDIMPSVLSMLGIEGPAELDGVDLTEPVVGTRSIYFETLEGLAEYGWSALLGVQRGSLKYIYGPTPEQYDLARDPFEEEDLASSRPGDAEDLKRELSGLFGDDLAVAAVARRTQRLDASELAKLESLGYVFGGSQDLAAQEPRPDPREMMPVLRRISAAFQLEHDDWVARAIAQLEQIVDEHPDLYVARKELGAAYLCLEQYDRAEAEFLRCAELRPGTVVPLRTLAMIKDRQGQTDAAIDAYRRVLEIAPGHFPALDRLGRLLLDRGAPAEAAALLRRAHTITPTDGGLSLVAADALVAADQSDEAINVLRATLATRPDHAVVRSKLARLLTGRGDYAEAESLLREGLKRAPDRLDLAANLAIVLTSMPNPRRYGQAEAVAIMERVCEQTDHQNPGYLHALSRAHAALGRLDEAVSWAERAQNVATATGQTRFVDTIRIDLEAFRQAAAKLREVQRGLKREVEGSSGGEIPEDARTNG